MPFFAFEAFDAMGKPATGRIEAASLEEANAKIRYELKLFAMKIEETTETGTIDKPVLDHNKRSDDDARPYRPNPDGPTIYDPDKPVEPRPAREIKKAKAKADEISFGDVMDELAKVGQPFERDELQALRSRALAQCNCVNPMWKLAYYELARAADHVDAMIARMEVEFPQGGPVPADAPKS